MSDLRSGIRQVVEDAKGTSAAPMMTTAFRLTKEEWEWFQELCAEHEVNRSKMLRSLVRVACEYMAEEPNHA